MVDWRSTGYNAESVCIHRFEWEQLYADRFKSRYNIQPISLIYSRQNVDQGLYLPLKSSTVPAPQQGVWVLSLLVAVPVLIHRGTIPSTHLEALLGAAACGAVFAELFCIKSLLIFEPRVARTDTDVSEPLWNLKHVRFKP